MSHARVGRISGLALVSVLALGACGTDSEPPGDAEQTTTVTATPPATDAPPEPVESPDPSPDPDTDPDAETDSPSDPGETGELPGEPTDIGPAAGDEVAVVGVAADDVLNVRRGPGVEYDIVARLDPLADGVATTGSNRQLESSIWVELTVDGTTGWANLAYLGYLGMVDDITSQLPVLPSGDDLVQVARDVAQQRMHPADAEVVVVDGPRSGDLAEVTVDVVGLMDDSVLGERLHVFARIDGDRFTVRTVEATTLCARGVTAERLCV